MGVPFGKKNTDFIVFQGHRQGTFWAFFEAKKGYTFIF